MKPIEIIKQKAVELPYEATGVIQEHLMDIGLTLAEADVLINGWYKKAGFDDDYFDKCDSIGLCAGCEKLSALNLSLLKGV